MPKNLPCKAKNAGFRPEKPGLPKPYTGATVALRWSYVELTDSLTPNRHRRWWNLTDRTGESATAQQIHITASHDLLTATRRSCHA